MKKYLCLVLLLLNASRIAHSQGSYLESVKHTRPRFGDQTGFVLIAGGGDRWPFSWPTWDSTRSQGWPPTTPTSLQYSDHYRFNDPLVHDTVGMNGINDGGLWVTLRDTGSWINSLIGNDKASWFDATPDTLVKDPREPLSSYIKVSMTGEDAVMLNALCIRFECERHHRATSTSWDDSDFAEYAGFVTDSTTTLIGHDTLDSRGQATFPLWLRGTLRAADTLHTLVRMYKGTDAAGLFENRLSMPTFLSSSPYWHPDLSNRKLVISARIRLDSMNAADTLSKLLALSSPKNAFSIKVLERNGSSFQPLLSDTFTITTANFPHAGNNFDTLFTFPFLANLTNDSIKIQMYWFGNASLSADYIDIMTDSCGVDDTTKDAAGLLAIQDKPASDFVRYNGGRFVGYNYLVNHGGIDTVINRLFKPYDSLANFTWTDEDPPGWGSVDFQKRFAKRLRDLTNIEYIHYIDSAGLGMTGDPHARWWWYPGVASIPTAYLEGVSRGWFDSSKYADPRYFALEEYRWNFTTPLPRRITAMDTVSLHNWVNNHARQWAVWAWGANGAPGVEITPYKYYNRDFYTKCSQDSTLAGLIDDLRWAKRVTERTKKPGFHQRFFVALQSGATANIYDSTNAAQHAGFPGLRDMTGAEWKASAHLTVALGASGIIPYEGVLGAPAGQSTIAAVDGGLCSPWGYHDSEFVHVSNLDDEAYTGTHDEDVWMGWNERFDTAAKVFPLLRLYGDTLLKCNWLGDYRAYETSPGSSIPFYDTIRAADDSNRLDRYSKIKDTNRTYAFVSVWQDTLTKDTLLYIVNMRTDDSWDTTGNCSMQDRRYISMRLKANHMVTDVADIGLIGSYKVVNNYVDVSSPSTDSLKVWLLPGDGVLVRLSPAKLMPVAIDFPKTDTATHDYYNHGYIQFDRPLDGVESKSSPTTWRVPSATKHYAVGVPDTSTVTFRQDSLLYRRFDTIRPERWRHQNWSDVNGQHYGFQRHLTPILSGSSRPGQTGLDSIAHWFSVSTDLEGLGGGGNFKFNDPFFVDASYNNQSGFTVKSNPFILDSTILSDPGVPGSPLASHTQHYGGVFRKQHLLSFDTSPGYSLHAYQKFTWFWLTGLDTLPTWQDWSFLGWWRNDSLLGTTADSNKWLPFCLSSETPITILKDSASYVAHYKAHNEAYLTSGSKDTGYGFNNQRKMVYIGRDSTNRGWYRNVFTSAGRIYTASGRDGDYVPPYADFWTNWRPEELVSDWNNTHASFPALAMHKFGGDTIFSIVYQQMVDTARHYMGIMHAYKDSNGHWWSERVDSDSSGNVSTEATPVIARVDAPGSPGARGDVIAWTQSDGIHLRAIATNKGKMVNQSSERIYLDTTAKYPTVWAGDSSSTHDTSFVIFVWGTDTMRLPGRDTWTPFWIAWQQRHACPPPPAQRPPGATTVWDILVQKLQLHQIEIAGITYWEYIDTLPGEPVDTVSYTVWPQSYNNFRPCLSGLNSADTCTVMVAYESDEYLPTAGPFQGVTVAKTRSPGLPWTKSVHITAPPGHYYGQPSLQVTKYKQDTVQTYYFYSVAFEDNSNSVWNCALDSNTFRVTIENFSAVHSPQLSVEADGQDSNVRRTSLDFSTPANLENGRMGLFKMNVNHGTLQEYRQVSEQDDSDSYWVTHGMGELIVDNGSVVTPLDLIYRPDTLGIDSAHPASWFMRTETFTLPATGSFYYTPWIATSNDTQYFSLHHDPVVYYLGFYDTTGSLLTVLDSIGISDSVRSIAPAMRTITLDYPKDWPGFVALSRNRGKLRDSGAKVQDIITPRRFSAEKQRAKGLTAVNPEDVVIATDPNPFRDYTTVDFVLPQEAVVTIEVQDALGKEIGKLMDCQVLHAGEHTINWHPSKLGLPSGVYTVVLHYGNSAYTSRVIYMK